MRKSEFLMSRSCCVCNHNRLHADINFWKPVRASEYCTVLNTAAEVIHCISSHQTMPTQHQAQNITPKNAEWSRRAVAMRPREEGFSFKARHTYVSQCQTKRTFDLSLRQCISSFTVWTAVIAINCNRKSAFVWSEDSIILVWQQVKLRIKQGCFFFLSTLRLSVRLQRCRLQVHSAEILLSWEDQHRHPSRPAATELWTPKADTAAAL